MSECRHAHCPGDTSALTHALTRSLTHSLTHAFTYARTHARTHSLTHSLTHSRTHSPTHSLTHARTHSLTHAFTLTSAPVTPSFGTEHAWCAEAFWYLLLVGCDDSGHPSRYVSPLGHPTRDCIPLYKLVSSLASS